MKRAEGSQRGEEIFPFKRIQFWVSFLWSSDSGFPEFNQQVTVASRGLTLRGPASKFLGRSLSP